MSNPLSMFHDEDGSGDWSTTRVNAFLVILSVCAATLILAFGGKTINWPLAVFGMSAVFAVPLKQLFNYLQQWFTSSPGQKLLGALMAKVAPMIAGSTSSTTTVHAETHTDEGKG